jgi:predicted O-methyltransferase YrrM
MNRLPMLYSSLFEDIFSYLTFSHLIRIIKNTFGNTPIEGVEIGTMRGASAFWLMTLLPNIMHLYTVDPWAHVDNSTMEQIRPQDFHNENYEVAKQVLDSLGSRITIVRDFSDNFFTRMKYESRQFDFIWIDGHHERFQVDKDIANAKILTKKGGLILGHDFVNCLGVKAGVEEAFKGKQVSVDQNSQIWSTIND